MFYRFLSVIIYFCFLHNNSALSEKWNIDIEGYLSGFKVGESNVFFEINNEEYLLTVSSSTTGITKLFYPWRQIIEASGLLNDLIVKPLIYSIKDIRENKENGFINIEYQNNYPIIISAYPKPENDTRRNKVSKNLLKNTFDPVNSIVYLGFLAANSNSCNHIIKVFDGRRRFNLEFIEINKHNNEIKCKLKIKRIAGYSKKELTKHPKEGIIVLKKISDNTNFYFPTEVKIPLTIGSFYVKLSKNYVLH